MAIFLGEFDHQIDRKLRISLPAPFRKRLAKEQDGDLVVRPGIEPCLYVATEKSMETLMERIGSNQRGWDEKTRAWLTLSGSQSATVALDEQGRLQLNQKQMDYAGLTDRAIIVGCFGHIEVWNEARYRQHLETVAKRIDYRTLSEQVMRADPPGPPPPPVSLVSPDPPKEMS